MPALFENESYNPLLPRQNQQCADGSRLVCRTFRGCYCVSDNGFSRGGRIGLGIGIAVAVLLVIIFLSLCVRRRRRAQFNSTSFATSSANNNQTSNPYAAGGQSQYQQGYAQGGYNQGYNAQSPAVGYNQYPPPQGAPPTKESEGEMVDGQPFNPSQTGNYAPPPGPPPPTYQKET